MAYLEVSTQDGARFIALDRERLSIGRLSYNDVALPLAQISRQHAELRFISGQWWVADLHSTNGVQLNGRRIQEHALQPGDILTLAPNVTVTFHEGAIPAGGAGHPTTPRATPPTPHPTPPTGTQPPTTPIRPNGPHNPNNGNGPYAPPNSIGPLKPRSIFSDDESPYIPPGIGQQPPLGGPSGAGPGGFFPPPLAPFPINGANIGRPGDSGGYPAPRGALAGGGAFDQDPYYRPGGSGMTGFGAKDPEGRFTTAGPASTLLHVCQTCGQLTPPDTVYCQSCHQSIARECAACGLSLLPAQERCQRCHTPNPAWVGRTRPHRT